MKKVLLVIVGMIVVLAATVLIWKVVIPFIGWALGGIFGGMTASFTGISDLIKSLF